MPRSSLPSRLTQPSSRTQTPASSRAGSNQPSARNPQPSALPAIKPAEPSPLIQALRRDYRWAAISQFLWTFGDGLGLTSTNWDVDALERDLDSPEDDILVPDILVKLLYALTYDRLITRSTLEPNLRKQYLLRSPRTNPFGSLRTHPIDPRPWAELGLGQKVAALHDLCEWQLADPARFRALLKNEGEMDSVAWRIEPCGWDKDENTYWLFDDNRLWVQHPPPPEPKPPKPLKVSAKKAAASRNNKKGKNATGASSKTVSTSASTPDDAPASKKSHKRRERPVAPSPEFEGPDEEMDRETARAILLNEELGLRSTSSRRSTRTQDAALLARAKSIADPTAPIGRRTRTQTTLAPPTPLTVASHASGSFRLRTRGGEALETPSKRPRNTMGTRGSYRLRGAEESEDEQIWQEIPQEWLSPNARTSPDSGKGAAVEAKSSTRVKAKGKGKTNPVVDDSDSELSELSDADEPDVPSGGVSFGEQADVEMAGPTELEPTETEPSRVVEQDTVPMQVDGAVPLDGAEVLLADSSAEAIETSAEAMLNKVEAEGGSPETPDPKTGSAIEGREPVKGGESSGDCEIAKAIEGTGEEGKAGEQDAGVVLPAIYAEPPKLVSKPKEEDVKMQDDQQERSLEEEYPEEEIDANDYVRLESKKARERTFLEWEAVCVDRWDWENFPLRFKGSKHVDEKAFYVHLTQNLCPGIIVALREKETEAAKQEAIRNRKRSSRILTRELEREEQQAAEDARREMEVRMQRVQNEERRKAAEEEEKAAKEREREERLREREDRMKQREEAIYEKALAEAAVREKLEVERQRRAARREAGLSNADSGDEAVVKSAPDGKGQKRKADQLKEAADEAWELACEVCHQAGWNVEDERPIVACETCGRWQHQGCHDSRDDSQGRIRRDWDNVDFFCADCRRRKARERERPESREGGLGVAAHPASSSPGISPIKITLPRPAVAVAIQATTTQLNGHDIPVAVDRKVHTSPVVQLGDRHLLASQNGLSGSIPLQRSHVPTPSSSSATPARIVNGHSTAGTPHLSRKEAPAARVSEVLPIHHHRRGPIHSAAPDAARTAIAEQPNFPLATNQLPRPSVSQVLPSSHGGAHLQRSAWQPGPHAVPQSIRSATGSHPSMLGGSLPMNPQGTFSTSFSRQNGVFDSASASNGHSTLHATDVQLRQASEMPELHPPPPQAS